LGQAYAALREFDNANAAYYRASLNVPQNSEAYYGLGITYLSLSRSATDGIRKIDPNAPLARSLLAEAFLEQGRLEDAISEYQALLNSGSLPNSMCWFPGIAYSRQGKTSEAAAEFQRLVSQNPSCLGAHLGLASLRLREGDVSGALDELGRAWKVDSGFLEANLGSVWQQFKPEELTGVLHTLTENPLDSDADTRSLVTSSLKRWLDGNVKYARPGPPAPSTFPARAGGNKAPSLTAAHSEPKWVLLLIACVPGVNARSELELSFAGKVGV
jgi:tetratricopeptide (TPR) repeat protein